MSIYGYSNHEVIEVLCNADPYALDYGNGGSPEDWLQDILEQSDIGPWTVFTERRSLSEFANFEDLQQAWENFEEEFMDTAWDLDAIEDAIEEEVENVFQNLIDNMDSDDKFNLIQERC